MAAEKPSIRDQLRKLKEEQEKLVASQEQLLAGVKDELLAKGQEIVTELAEYGFEYEFVDRSVEPTRTIIRKRRGKSTGSGVDHSVKAQRCPFCNFETKPPHDGRKHRSQGEHKTPFTPAELQKWELERV
jgi:hypothetical protein